MTVPAPERLTPFTDADLPAGMWRTAVPIRFGRCDAAGIVYTPHYIDLFIGATEVWYIEALGIDYYRLLDRRRIGMGYARVACDFFAPSRMGETLDIGLLVERIGRSSVTVTLHAMAAGRERARGRFVSVATSADDWRPIPLPADLASAFRGYTERCTPSPSRPAS